MLLLPPERQVVKRTGQRGPRRPRKRGGGCEEEVIHNAKGAVKSQQTLHETLDQCWPNIADSSPTLSHHWISVSCFLG